VALLVLLELHPLQVPYRPWVMLLVDLVEAVEYLEFPLPQHKRVQQGVLMAVVEEEVHAVRIASLPREQVEQVDLDWCS
jgi:hypothetical protein